MMYQPTTAMAAPPKTRAALLDLITAWLERAKNQSISQQQIAVEAGLSESMFYNTYRNSDPRRKITANTQRHLQTLQAFARHLTGSARPSAEEVATFLWLTDIPERLFAKVQGWWAFTDADWHAALRSHGLEVERPLILLPKHSVSGGITRHYKFFDERSRYAPTFSDLLDQDSKQFLNMLDAAKRRADDARLRAQGIPLDDQRSRKIQDYIFRIYKDIWFIQRKWFQVHGRYFQGKATMSTVPSFEQDDRVEFSFGLTDQVDDWTDIGYIDEYAPVQLECHVYEGPKGLGFTAYARVQVDGQIRVNQMHYGPEDYRDSDNFSWMRQGR